MWAFLDLFELTSYALITKEIYEIIFSRFSINMLHTMAQETLNQYIWHGFVIHVHTFFFWSCNIQFCLAQAVCQVILFFGLHEKLFPYTPWYKAGGMLHWGLLARSVFLRCMALTVLGFWYGWVSACGKCLYMLCSHPCWYSLDFNDSGLNAAQ